MALWATLHPDYDHPQVPPPAEVRSAESLGVPRWLEIDPKNPVFILRKKVSGRVGEVLHTADKWAITKGTAEKTGELRIEREKKEFLAKLIPTLKADSPIKQAIEKKTLQIHEVPSRSLYAMSLDWKSIDYLYEKTGKEYYDFAWSREDQMRYAALRGLSDSTFKEIREWDRFILNKNWKNLPLFSEDSLVEYARWADYLIKGIKRLKEIEKLNW